MSVDAIQDSGYVTILHLFSRKKPGLHGKNYKSGSRIAGEKWREYLKMPNINLN
jgi:hypothetical protein